MCSSRNDTLPLILAFADKIILVLLGLFFSFEIREAPPLGDSRQVAISIYNITIFGTCGLILTILLERTPINLFVFCSTLVVCCTTIKLIVLFLPLVRKLHLNFYF
ncbi:Gamma-aminobutyric acid type B receptor subunit 2 [Holothuria leucospilota]|uniref:Gamma-aminobutyric acid type B receptor subunit 2 n=1 Tax=Holothuria leucospilota TaxID=206669 RepID=A0A9Q1CFI9_HOLLE|nr:Gamma-aminobutyric acid type B receptor subunit 2 [Holothuria leucospilota]